LDQALLEARVTDEEHFLTAQDIPTPSDEDYLVDVRNHALPVLLNGHKVKMYFYIGTWSERLVFYCEPEVAPYFEAMDLRDFNVNTRRSELTVGNFKLTESLLSGINSLLEGKIEKSYDLGLADKRYGSDNKIVNSKVTFKEIQRILNGFVISQSDYENNGEVAINKMLEVYFQGHFENASRSGGAKKSYYDLIIGDPEKNEGFAVELKLASSLANNAGQRQRASGQVKEYVKNLKNNNLILLIIGPKTEYSNKNIKSLEEEIESDYNCYFIYHSVK
jgi:hypothetical protein